MLPPHSSRILLHVNPPWRCSLRALVSSNSWSRQTGDVKWTGSPVRVYSHSHLVSRVPGIGSGSSIPDQDKALSKVNEWRNYFRFPPHKKKSVILLYFSKKYRRFVMKSEGETDRGCRWGEDKKKDKLRQEIKQNRQLRQRHTTQSRLGNSTWPTLGEMLRKECMFTAFLNTVTDCPYIRSRYCD